MRRPLSKKGFTFIELLTAVTLFSIISVGLYSAFRNGVRLWDRSTVEMEENQNTRVLSGTLSSDLRNAVAFSPDLPFQGTLKKIVFMTLASRRPARGLQEFELVRVTYLIETAKKRLYRSISTQAEGFAPSGAQNEEFVMTAPEAGFRYAYSTEGSHEILWRDQWKSEDGALPRGVEFVNDFQREVFFLPQGLLKGTDD